MGNAKTKNYKNFEVNILGEIWQVVFSDTVIDPSTGNMAVGRCDGQDCTILVLKGMDEKLTIVTFLHELFHAYTRRSGIYNGMLSFDMEEIISDQFATVLAENFNFTL